MCFFIIFRLVRLIRNAAASRRNGKGQVVLVGSSILAFWRKAGKDLAPIPIVNCAVGGSTTFDLQRWTEPVQAAVIVLYCGSNDLRQGYAPEAALQRLEDFCNRQGATPIIIVSAIQSPDRAAWANVVDQYNLGLAAIVARDPAHRTYVDVNDGLRGRRQCFRWDGLHLTRKGYAAFAAALRPFLERVWASRLVQGAPPAAPVQGADPNPARPPPAYEETTTAAQAGEAYAAEKV